MKEAAFDRFLDRSMGRELNITGVGGLLFIPSINLEPRMDASAKGADRPHFGIRPPHTSHSFHRGLQPVDSLANLQAVRTEAPIRNVRSRCSF
jgi:hypothetical protein